jgi:hypothetical protein
MSGFDTELAGLSSAEDFFVYFGLAFDPQIVAASRLHILKQFHDNLGGIAGLDTLPDARLSALCHGHSPNRTRFSQASTGQRRICRFVLAAHAA